MRRYAEIVAVALALTVIVAATGCKKSTTQIGSIAQDPGRFQGKSVQVAGQVTKSYSANLVIAEFGAYQVDDGTGRIWVISRNGVPQEGQTVGVRGTVGSGLKLGSEVLGVLIREEARRVR